ncbi:MAG TPA: urease accessory UreF family protein [Vulgatibacter sp.]
MELPALVRLLRLASPALPVGAYGYSQGLETVIESGLAATPAAVEAWIGDHLRCCLARGDAAYFWRIWRSILAGDHDEALRWDEEYLASRGSAELRAESLQMGASLARLLESIEGEGMGIGAPSWLAAFAWAAARWRIPPREALAAWLFSWLEAQILAWLKTGSAGQMAGQAALARLSGEVASIVDASERLRDDEIHTFAPGLALASFHHEDQDGRLFRS